MKRRPYYIFVCIVASGLLSGCGVYTRYSRPDLEVNVDSLYRTAVMEKDSVTIASKPWRELFTDPYLRSVCVVVPRV